MAQINKPTDYFNTITYTGDNTDRSFTGVGFQPDWVWVKARNNTTWHMLFDAVRGAGVEKELHANSTQAEGASDNVAYGYINSFDTDGFSTIDGTSASDALNESGKTYVAWNWLAGGTASSNTDGSITSTVSANTTSGFSIVSYTGTGSAATIGHGLGVTPAMIITKARTAAYNWFCFHQSLGVSQQIVLDVTDAASSYSGYWSSVGTSTYGVGTNSNLNQSGINYISYVFAEKTGYSKFGSYTGNGNADGTFIYTGFKPAFVIRKNADAISDWRMDDNKRPGYNVIPYTLFPNLNNAETTSSGYYVDLLSNGFKVRGTSVNQNTSGQTYIYMALAENPLVGTNNIPATAR